MNDPRKISISDFTYALPEERIALRPLTERDASKLLIYRNGQISEDSYRNIADHIPSGSLLVFNNSKVINARIRFRKSSGGVIEIFCLEPMELLNEYSSIMNMTGSVKWKCLVGGASKWKDAFLEKRLSVNGKEFTLKAVMLEKLPDAYVIGFSWDPHEYSFAEVIEQAGDVPLPPYIKRETDISDTGRYQTIYADPEGSVAAPTAGLHFTEYVFRKLSEKNIVREYVTLHVGAGTFKPVKAAKMGEHEMHTEWIDVSLSAIKHILQKSGSIIAVGTTSLRTLETLYWLGAKAILDPGMEKPELKQWEVYESPLQHTAIPVNDALSSLISWMESRNLNRLFTQTQLLITAGYQVKTVNALITNFHQPQSTLLLLVAAIAGDDWKKIYQHALDNEYRFLSYGDGNLIFLNKDRV